MADDTEKVVIERPQHPLPEEINQLSEEETQCKFCGISYLIHREVARLKVIGEIRIFVETDFRMIWQKHRKK